MKLAELVVLVWIVLGRDVVDVVWPVLPKICKIDRLVGGLSSSHDRNLFIIVYNIMVVR